MSNEVSMTVSESNALRLSLGLAPLEESTATKYTIVTPTIPKAAEPIRKVVVKGKTLSSGPLLNSADWISSVGSKASIKGKSSKTKSKQVGGEEVDLEGLQVSHRLEDISASTILVLQDSMIGDDEPDKLHSIQLTEKETRERNLARKKGKAGYEYDVHDAFQREQDGREKVLLGQYDEEEAEEGFTLGSKGTVDVQKEQLRRSDYFKDLGGETLDYDKNKKMEDYEDVELSFRKKKKRKASKRVAIDSDEELKVYAKDVNSNRTTDVGKIDFVDDGDLQREILRTRQRKVKALVFNDEVSDVEMESGGLVFTELSGFLDILPSKEAMKARATETADIEAPIHIASVMDRPIAKEVEIVNEDDVMKSDTEESSEDDTAGRGLAGVLNLLKQKGDIKVSAEQSFKDQIERERSEWSDKQKGRSSDKGLSERDRINSESKRYDSYKPNVSLIYRDDAGRELNSKEAFRQIAQKFHGKTSGKKKTEKRLQKLEDELVMRKSVNEVEEKTKVVVVKEKRKPVPEKAKDKEVAVAESKVFKELLPEPTKAPSTTRAKIGFSIRKR